jgi:hypothetical protein
MGFKNTKKHKFSTHNNPKKNIRLLFNNQTSPNKLQINHFSC